MQFPLKDKHGNNLTWEGVSTRSLPGLKVISRLWSHAPAFNHLVPSALSPQWDLAFLRYDDWESGTLHTGIRVFDPPRLG